MRIINRRWIVVLGIFIILPHQITSGEDTSTHSDNENANDNRKDIIIPRMDYDQWKPLGRGDPLKNDPTYDYVPPVLDRVHYWIEPELRKPDASQETPKAEVLLLGVTSKKPATQSAESRHDPHDQFLKFVDGPKFNPHQRIARPYYTSYLPSLFFSSNKKPERSPFSKGSDQRLPYTMLMPPPAITTKPPSISITPMTTGFMKSTQPTPLLTSTSPSTGEVTIQPSKLIYHSSSLTDGHEWNIKNPATSSPIIKFNDDIVFQKHLQPPQSYIQIEFSPRQHNLTNKPLLASNSDHNINYVTPPPLVEEVMHKGQVSDDNLDISNTYVKIGKTEAQVHSSGPDMPAMPEMVIRQPPILRPMIFSHVKHKMPPMTMQTMESMQTMQPPPPPTPGAIFPKPTMSTFEKEKITETTMMDVPEMTTIPEMTTSNTLTTDPLFKHYKQPAEPLKGPLYLIIQGHSKVKTYGPSKEYHGIPVQESNEISDDKDEFKVKHLHGFQKEKRDLDEPRESRSGNLQTLKHVIQTGFGAIDLDAITDRKDENMKETELESGYEIGEADITTETYYKGTVEEARKLKIL